MRRVALLVAVVGGLMIPASAQARPSFQPEFCGCTYAFTHAFTGASRTSKSMRARYNRDMRAYFSRAHVRMLRRRGIYDVERNGYVNKGWCKRNPKWCRAAKACLIAAGNAYVAAIAPDGHVSTAEWAAISSACTGAAISVVVL